MVLEMYRLGVELSRVVAEQQGLHFHELNVGVLDVLVRWWCWRSELLAVLVLLRCTLSRLAVCRGSQRVIDWRSDRPGFALKRAHTRASGSRA